MRFFEVVLSGAALIAAALAVELNDVPSSIEPGKTYKITYSPKDNTPTTLKLRKGDPNDLDTIATLTTTATNGEFEWTVDNALPNAKDYALEISQQGSEPNYSGLITLSGGSDASSAASSGSASATPSATSSEESATAASTTLLTTATSASASISSTAGTNSTISSATLSPSSTGSETEPTGSGSPTTGAGAPESTGAASTLASSPLALIFGAVAAMAYLN